MGFLSLKFILFITMTFSVYFMVPKKYQWVVLLMASYLYYFLNSHYLVLILLVESVLTFFVGKALASLNEKIRSNGLDNKNKEAIKNKKKLLTTAGIIADLGILVVFKYTGFIIQTFNDFFNFMIALFDLLLPLGISFYTLQAISYVVDVSKSRTTAEDNLLHFLLYMSYFPQIIQGPIPRYGKLSHQLFEEHDYDYERITRGLQLMLWGIAKKVIIADRIAKPVNYFFNNYSEFTGITVLAGALCYGFQVYADFSGGIDTIKGISEVFGIYLDENFRQPFFSRSVEEFWRRWHITLGSWMKDYVFYPLSLSKSFNKLGKRVRKTFGDKIGKKIAPCIAMFVVYFLVGIWHGAGWKYIVYGIWNGIFIMSGILFEDRYKKMYSIFGIDPDSKFWILFTMIRTLLVTSIGRIISRSGDLRTAFGLLGNMFIRPFDCSFVTTELFEALGLNYRNWILILVSIGIVLFVDYLKEREIDIRASIAKKNIVIRWAVYLLLVVSILVFGLYGGEYDASSFIYGRF